jgi:hypothetical protein
MIPEIEGPFDGRARGRAEDEAMHAAEQQLERAEDVTNRAYEAGREKTGS